MGETSPPGGIVTAMFDPWEASTINLADGLTVHRTRDTAA